MSTQPRETVTVPLPSGPFIIDIEVYYGDPDTPERKAQLSPGLREAQVKLAEGATAEDCLILVKQLDATKKPISCYVYCCGSLRPFNKDYHVLGWCCADDEPEVEPEPEPVYPDRPTLAEDKARVEEQPFLEPREVVIEESVEPLVLSPDLEVSELSPGDALSLDEMEDILDEEDKD